jgi:hypothetical protein
MNIGYVGDNEYYKISKKRLLKLLEADAKLEALENGGVDNWEWSGASMSDYLLSYIQEIHPDMEDDDKDDFWFDSIAEERLKNYEKSREN